MSFRPELHDIAAGASLLTRLPVPVDYTRAGARGAAAAWSYPLIGAAVGALAALVAVGLIWLGVPERAAIIAALAVQVLSTGALHEDGLADCADALGGGRDKAHRLEIFKDSRIGAFGCAALCLALLARLEALAVVPSAALLVVLPAAGAASRLTMAAAYTLLPPARPDGLAASLGAPPVAALGLGAVVALGLVVVLAGWVGIWALIAALALPLPLWFAARRLIGGQTGDVLGAVQQIGEIGALAALAAALA